MREKLNRQKYIKDNIDVKLNINQLIEEKIVTGKQKKGLKLINPF